MPKMVEFELYTDERMGLKISLDPDIVAVIEDLPDNDEACKIVCNHKSEYIVVGSRDFVAKKFKK
jgi:hypothetical protein